MASDLRSRRGYGRSLNACSRSFPARECLPHSSPCLGVSVVNQPTRTDSVGIFDAPGCDRLRRELRLDPALFRRLRNELLKRFRPDDVALAGLPAPNRLALHALDFVRRCDSTLDGATKLLLRTASGTTIETVVLRRATGRSTLCLSSQAGCAAACAFCATGKLGLAGNLTAAEILDQALRGGQLLAAENRSLRNVVFMGMGEPFHNERHLFDAIEILTSPEFFHFAPTRMLVSTVGVPQGMLRCAARFPRVRLALSLHSVRQSVRERLIPLARMHPLPLLRETIVELNRLSPAAVMIEYLLLAGVNDSSRDAGELIAWLDGLNVHVNLIPYNAIDDAPELVGSDPATLAAFAAALKRAGRKTTVRYSLGADISAACGQLVRRQAVPRSAT